ncbi:MAG: DUF4405 domain-containing protein [Paraclostridium sp.]
MNKKNIIKFTLDIAMVSLFITFFNKNLISFKFHIISGYIFSGLILMHLILNKKWIINISKKIFDKKLKLRVKISYILSFILLINIITIILSGILMMKSPSYDRLMFWKMMHFGTSYISIALIGIHIGLYWNFMMSMFKKVCGLNKSGKNYSKISKLIVIIILSFGIYKISSQNYLSKLSNTLTYVIQHIEPKDLKEPESKIYKQNDMTFIKLATTYGGIISVFGISTYYGDKSIKKYSSFKSKTKNNKEKTECA